MSFNSNVPRAEYIAATGQTAFPFVFKVFKTTDVKVYLTPNGQIPDDTTDLLVSGYSVTINGDSGGVVTLTTGTISGDKVTILRSLPILRDTDYQENGDLRASTLDSDQDYQTYLVGDLSAKIDKSVKLPQSAQGIDGTLPSPSVDNYIKWNATGTALENDTVLPGAVQLAKDWANEDEDVIVADSEYSSKHYSLKAKDEKDEATTQAGIATTQANLAISAYDAFDDRYLGSKAADPSVNNDGSALLTGAMYFNSSISKMRVYNGTTWMDAGSSINGVVNNQVFTATAGQTVFSFTYDIGFLSVYLNGVKLTSADFTATNGTSFTLGVACVVGDIVEAMAFGTFVVADHYTKSETDSLFVEASGDETISGVKTFSSSPIVPTPTTATQVASKGYADGLFVLASETVAGKVELATSAEVQAGTDTVRAVTPAGLKSAVIGLGQTWQDVTASRARDVTYTNTTGKPIALSVSAYSEIPAALNMSVNGVSLVGGAGIDVSSSKRGVVLGIVPHNSTYSVTCTVTPDSWKELR